jgi:hypothetical protein
MSAMEGMLGTACPSQKGPLVFCFVQFEGKIEWTSFVLSNCLACFCPTRYFLTTLTSSSFCRLLRGANFDFWVVWSNKWGAGSGGFEEQVAFWLVDMVVMASKGEMAAFLTVLVG